MEKVIMPKSGLTMKFGTIEKWRKKEGEEVQKGDILLDIMTDKISLEVESPYTGYLLKILKFEDEEIPVGDTIAYIGFKDEKIELDK